MKSKHVYSPMDQVFLSQMRNTNSFHMQIETRININAQEIYIEIYCIYFSVRVLLSVEWEKGQAKAIECKLKLFVVCDLNDVTDF